MKKSTIIISIAVVIGILGFGAVSYWYLMMYQPAEYAKAIIRLDEEIKAAGDIFSTPELKGNDDYDGALLVLRQRKDFLEGFQEKFTSLNLPLLAKDGQIKEDALRVLEIMLVMNNDAEERALFFVKAKELHEVFELVPEQKGTTIGDVQEYVTEVINQAKEKGQTLFETTFFEKTLFEKEPPEFDGEVSFVQLKSAWEKALPAFDVILPFFLSQDPSLPVTQQAQPPPDVKEASDATQEFIRLLKLVIQNNSAEDIVSYRFTGDAFQDELDTLNARFQEAIDKLKKEYPQ